MNWDSLPRELIEMIMYYRAWYTCGYTKKAIKIQSFWRCYKTRVLVGRFRMLRYLRDFREWNPTMYEFIVRSKL